MTKHEFWDILSPLLAKDTKQTPATLVTAAVILGNGLHDELTSHEDHALMSELGHAIDSLMTDGPLTDARFCLYDYLDAVVNNNARHWDDIAREIIAANDSENHTRQMEACVSLIRMAADKRALYSE